MELKGGAGHRFRLGELAAGDLGGLEGAAASSSSRRPSKTLEWKTVEPSRVHTGRKPSRWRVEGSLGLSRGQNYGAQCARGAPTDPVRVGRRPLPRSVATLMPIADPCLGLLPTGGFASCLGRSGCCITLIGLIGGCSGWSSRWWQRRGSWWQRLGSWSQSTEPSSQKRRRCATHKPRRRRARRCSGSSTASWGESRLAPGATAYVLGPHGSWLGAAGVAEYEHVRADAGGRANAPGEREQDLHGDADPAARPGGKAPRRRHRRQVAAWAAPVRKPDHDSPPADDEQRLDRQQRPSQRDGERAAELPRPRRGRQAAGPADRDPGPRRGGPGGGGVRDVLDPVGSLAAAPVYAGCRVPLLEHRLRHPRVDRRPRWRQAAGRAVPRADLSAARPPHDRLRPARADERPARPRLRDRAERCTGRHDRLALGRRRRGRHRLQRQGDRHLPHRAHARQASRPRAAQGR